MRKRLAKWCSSLYMVGMLIFLYAPILMLAAFSFSSERSRASWGHFTLQWYVELFRDREIMNALYTTLAVAVLSALLSTIVGTAAAIGIYGYRKSLRSLVLNVTYLPMVNPDIVTGISLMILFTFLRLELGFFTMLLAHMVFNIPYVIYAVLPKLMQIDKNAYEAALDLGAKPLVAVRRVLLPEIREGIVTGLILAFTLSLDDFVITFFTTSGLSNLSIYIYTAARRGIEPTLYALMTIMFLTVVTLLLVVNLRGRKNSKQLQRR